MKKIAFATHNNHKLEEIQSILKNMYHVMGLTELGITEEIPETADTLEGNAQMKADYLFDRLGIDCFADDTGLEVEALHGAPGVYSARYAGEHCSFSDNVEKILKELERIENRKAQFRTVICLILNGEKHFFEGIVTGELIKSSRGEKGFGYDPIFIPNGYSETFAEMPIDLKNEISHRGKATQKLIDFLAKFSGI
ncbi:MAG: non-canonical purine NTP diphosphatase [Bacteroidales bacterium]|nr:non-canonical purine NTP diphosphatase [Bacteroidales bacterium]